jgi:hypothetical protein
LLYYQVGVATDTRDELATVVRRLVNLLNLYLGGPRGEDIFQIQAASPNWFVVAASAQTCGGPGGKPEAAPAGDWRLHFADPALEHLREDAAGGPLHPVVAVLDTWPVSVDPLVFPGNWLLQDVASHVHLEPVPPLSVPSTSGASTVLDWYVPPGSSVPALEFGVSDHGLFVAGIVRDLAPAAEVHIYRVLDDCGVGDTLALSSVLERLPRELVGVPGHRPLVVNLSLVVDIPPEIRLFERWYQADRSRYSEKQYRAAWQALDMLAEPITASIDSVVQQGALVVGAAGNDAVPRTKGGPIERTLPRWPAQDPNVLAVAAVQRSGRAASYTNWATKAPGDPTGVAVFGGEGDFLDGWHGPPPTPTAVPFLPAGVYGPRFVPLAGAGGSEGIVGLSVAKVPTLVSCTNPTATPPPPPSTNTAGWVHWAGTSFATPIVSALAANRWATAPGLPPVGYPSVMQAVVSFAHIPVADPAAATPSSRPFGCNMLEVVQA